MHISITTYFGKDRPYLLSIRKNTGESFNKYKGKLYMKRNENLISGTMSESMEVRLHDEVILMLRRNPNKEWIWKRILNRMIKCLKGETLTVKNKA